VVNPKDKFDLVELSHYFDEEEDRYKHIRGVAAQMNVLVEQLGLEEEDKQKLMKIAYLHDIGYSKRVMQRGHHALDGAIFALEHAMGEEVALAIMFHTAAYGEVKRTGSQVAIYEKAYELLKQNEKASYFASLITYCNLRTEVDGTPTTVNRRIFKMLSRYEKNSEAYKNIKAHKHYFKRLEKRIRLSVVKQKTWWQEILATLQAKTEV
jgi:putative nucleotidyltransferase with HDIG domain